MGLSPRGPPQAQTPDAAKPSAARRTRRARAAHRQPPEAKEDRQGGEDEQQMRRCDEAWEHAAILAAVHEKGQPAARRGTAITSAPHRETMAQSVGDRWRPDRTPRDEAAPPLVAPPHRPRPVRDVPVCHFTRLCTAVFGVLSAEALSPNRYRSAVKADLTSCFTRGDARAVRSCLHLSGEESVVARPCGGVVAWTDSTASTANRPSLSRRHAGESARAAPWASARRTRASGR